MVSLFGKFLRKLRIDIEITMKEMAKKLGISTAYLSALELGKNKINQNIVKKVIVCFKLDKKQSNELQNAAAKANGEIKIQLSNFSRIDQDAILLFVREHFKTPNGKE